MIWTWHQGCDVILLLAQLLCTLCKPQICVCSFPNEKVGQGPAVLCEMSERSQQEQFRTKLAYRHPRNNLLTASRGVKFGALQHLNRGQQQLRLTGLDQFAADDAGHGSDIAPLHATWTSSNTTNLHTCCNRFETLQQTGISTSQMSWKITW